MLVKTGKYFVYYHSTKGASSGYKEYTFVVDKANSFAHAEKIFESHAVSLNSSIHKICAELSEV